MTAIVVGESKTMNILVDQLVLDEQQILTLPSSLFKVQAGSSVVFSEIVLPVVEEIIGTQPVVENTEKDWALLISDLDMPSTSKDLVLPLQENVDASPTEQSCSKEVTEVVMRNESSLIMVATLSSKTASNSTSAIYWSTQTS